MLKILYLEGQATQFILWAKALRNEGWTVDRATTVEEAEDLYKTGDYDFALLDPCCNGFFDRFEAVRQFAMMFGENSAFLSESEDVRDYPNGRPWFVKSKTTPEQVAMHIEDVLEPSHG